MKEYSLGFTCSGAKNVVCCDDVPMEPEEIIKRLNETAQLRDILNTWSSDIGGYGNLLRKCWKIAVNW